MLNNIEQELKQFAEYVVKESRANLKRQGKDSTGKLSKSIDSNVDVFKNSFSLSFLMEDYGTFQDKGVKGKSSSSKAPNSPFRFGSGTGRKGGLTEGINKWVQRKRFQFRDRKSGRFLSYKSTAFLISRSIYQKGIAPSLFFTKPFEKAFKGLSKDLLEPFKLDIETFMKNTINNKATR